MGTEGKVVAVMAAKETDTTEYQPILDELTRAGVECVIVAPDLDALEHICLAGDCPVTRGFDVTGACGVWFDALVIPGGRGVDAFLHDEDALDFVAAIAADGRPVAAIGRGQLLLVAADAVDGRHLAAPDELVADVTAVGGIPAVAALLKEGAGPLVTARGVSEAGHVGEALVCALADHVTIERNASAAPRVRRRR